jgi:hypothetical protein
VSTSGDATIPGWVTPAGRGVRDAHRIAYRLTVQNRDVRAAAVTAAINWVTGGQDAPITQRRGVTRELVWAEWLLAGSVETGAPMIWPADVTPARVVVDSPVWAAGTGAALGWLLGHSEKTPVPIPRRRPDGAVPTAEDVYREIVRSRPHAAWVPEQRAAARRRAAEVAAANASLAALADSA